MMLLGKGIFCVQLQFLSFELEETVSKQRRPDPKRSQIIPKDPRELVTTMINFAF